MRKLLQVLKSATLCALAIVCVAAFWAATLVWIIGSN
jgi:hypothetical protein